MPDKPLAPPHPSRMGQRYASPRPGAQSLMRASKRQQAHDITVIPKDYSPAPDQIHLLMCIQERNLLGQTLGKADIVRVHPGNVTPARQFDALVQTLGESQPSAILDDTDSRVIQRERDPTVLSLEPSSSKSSSKSANV